MTQSLRLSIFILFAIPITWLNVKLLRIQQRS